MAIMAQVIKRGGFPAQQKPGSQAGWYVASALLLACFVPVVLFQQGYLHTGSMGDDSQAGYSSGTASAASVNSESRETGGTYRLVACSARTTRLRDVGAELDAPRTEVYRAYITRPSGATDYVELTFDPRDGSSIFNHPEGSEDVAYRTYGSSPEANLRSFLDGKADRIGGPRDIARDAARVGIDLH
jgi:hypothetical protein